MSELAPPEFVSIDPKAIELDLIARYEEISGKKLYPAQIEHLFINLLAYAKTRTLARIQHTGEQMLPRFSEAPIIDYLAELVGVIRLPAQPARCTLCWQLDAVLSKDIFIPMFTVVGNEDGSVSFSTDLDVVIPAGSLSVDVSATCQVVGQQGNGYLPGKINKSERLLDAGLLVSNTSTTTGGDDEETTPALRERMMLAPEGYTSAGSYGAYKFHALSVHQSIIDVVVLGPDLDNRIPPGQVWIYPLTKDGLPTVELIQLIETKLSSEKKRPINDRVLVKVPEIVEYDINAELTLYRSADVTTTISLAEKTITAWEAARALRLGVDIVPHQVSKTLSVSGVYDITLNSPAKRIVKPYEWAVCTDIQVHPVGISDE
ncbi:baseplate J/gp47 family protein [Budviciaceae bacterium BWR-B9]|uniref:Baseplate J/gp47 family protein n=1 Tax=Limnobaculum allomyrinae TaxID=2791986 RepID=A0ABS1IMK1_9GAMM|nr:MULTISPECIES: baseplate J/gp47 family protein [Limnobaculum]MBK5142980.1 baseplate J/gp47 family protein [Limnobaculum allomyrinae]MBV7693309.1 baseplate J/gp47 family protein [Limnobaculum sp. M2-1]